MIINVHYPYLVNFNPRNLEDYSWAQLAAISAAGNAGKYFRVGDTKTVSTQSFTSRATLIGTNQDIVPGQAGSMTFMLTNSMNNYQYFFEEGIAPYSHPGTGNPLPGGQNFVIDPLGQHNWTGLAYTVLRYGVNNYGYTYGSTSYPSLIDCYISRMVPSDLRSQVKTINKTMYYVTWGQTPQTYDFPVDFFLPSAYEALGTGTVTGPWYQYFKTTRLFYNVHYGYWIRDAATAEITGNVSNPTEVGGKFNYVQAGDLVEYGWNDTYNARSNNFDHRYVLLFVI